MNKYYNFLMALMVALSFTACDKGGVEVTTLTENGELNWISIEEAEKIDNKEGKKFLVDMYTDWCGWCKVMDKKTFTDQKVKDYLDKNFYVVKFNAEQKEPVTFKGQTYEWMNRGRKGVNKLAFEFLNGRLGYPTMVYLDENLEFISAKPGYRTPDQLIMDLKGVSP